MGTKDSVRLDSTALSKTNSEQVCGAAAVRSRCKARGLDFVRQRTIAGKVELTVNMMNPQPQNSNTQLTSTTTAVTSEGGFQFEIKMAAVIGLHGLK